MASINKNTVKEQITDALIADLATTVAKLQKECGVIEENINKLFQLIGKPEDQKVETSNTDLESSKKSKNITEWLIKIHEMGNVPNDVVKILRKGLGMTMDAYKKSHKKEIDAKEGKEIKVLIGFIMRDLNNTSAMTELINLYASLNKEIEEEGNDSSESDADSEESEKTPVVKKTPVAKKVPVVKKATVAKKAVASPKSDSETSSESDTESGDSDSSDGEEEKEVPKKITSKATKVAPVTAKTTNFAPITRKPTKGETPSKLAKVVAKK